MVLVSNDFISRKCVYVSFICLLIVLIWILLKKRKNFLVISIIKLKNKSYCNDDGNLLLVYSGYDINILKKFNLDVID